MLQFQNLGSLLEILNELNSTYQQTVNMSGGVGNMTIRTDFMGRFLCGRDQQVFTQSGADNTFNPRRVADNKDQNPFQDDTTSSSNYIYDNSTSKSCLL